MRPNACLYNPDPNYLRQLVSLTGLSQENCARALGVAPRTFRYYLSTAADHQDAPYTVQFALESLAARDAAELELIREAASETARRRA